MADGIGFDYRTGNQIYLQVGDGSFIPIYLHKLEVQVGTQRLITQIGFSDKLGVGFNLLVVLHIYFGTFVTYCMAVKPTENHL
jgi:hypothetical protein